MKKKIVGDVVEKVVESLSEKIAEKAASKVANATGKFRSQLIGLKKNKEYPLTDRPKAVDSKYTES